MTRRMHPIPAQTPPKDRAHAAAHPTGRPHAPAQTQAPPPTEASARTQAKASVGAPARAQGCATAPASEAELLDRARRLAGHSLGTIAAWVGEAPPLTLSRAKGYVGALLERILGATAGPRAAPDFPELGVELKTIPIDSAGRVRESTFVCSVPLVSLGSETFEQSVVGRKLSRVLLIPVEADRDTAVSERRVGSPLLWSPTEAERSLLREDWEELADLVFRGFVESITAHRGVALQIRPKGRNSSARRWGHAEGELFRTAPKAFYLRASFMNGVIRRSYALP